MCDMEENELRDYIWNYFSLHSEQRLKTFHFFVIISTLIVGATLTILKDIDSLIYSAPMAFLLAFIAFIFWKLDQRNIALIKHSEDALKELESGMKIPAHFNKPEQLRVFTNEELKTNNKNKAKNILLLNAHLSYRNCFNSVFFVFGASGFVFGLIVTIRAFVC